MILNSRHRWSDRVSAMEAGTAYFVIVFSFAFLMGIVRVTTLVPITGDMGAVLIEIPVVLAISWFSSGYLTGRLEDKEELVQRLIMGGLAFVLLMTAEAGLSLFLVGRTLSEYFGSFQNPAAILGLIGQMGFALIPALQIGSYKL